MQLAVNAKNTPHKIAINRASSHATFLNIATQLFPHLCDNYYISIAIQLYIIFETTRWGRIRFGRRSRIRCSRMHWRVSIRTRRIGGRIWRGHWGRVWRMSSAITRSLSKMSTTLSRGRCRCRITDLMATPAKRRK